MDERKYLATFVALLVCPEILAWQAISPPTHLMGRVPKIMKRRHASSKIHDGAALAMADDVTSLTGVVSESALDSKVCEQFKILACSSTSCSQKRKVFGIDEFATVGALWERKEDAGASGVEVEESPCLGRCKLAPCVAIQHEDYEGTVSLEGMTQAEFNDKVFHKIITEEDCDRVWQSVENAIRVMAEETSDDEERYV